MSERRVCTCDAKGTLTNRLDGGDEDNELYSCGHLARAGRYRVTRLVSEKRGIFGHVHTARDEELDRNVAIKVLKPERADDNEAFLREMHLLARIKHPQIPRVYDCGQLKDGRAWVAMEHIDGEDLSGYHAHPDVASIARALGRVKSLLTTLRDIHEVSITHGDPHTGNLIPDAGVSDGEERLYLVDFGKAALVRPDSQSARAVAFRAPEMLTVPATPMADRYRTAIDACQFLSPRSTEQYPKYSIGTIHPGVSPKIVDVIAKALHCDYSTTPELLKAFLDAVAEGLPFTPEPAHDWEQRLKQWCRKRWIPVSIYYVATLAATSTETAVCPCSAPVIVDVWRPEGIQVCVVCRQSLRIVVSTDPRTRKRTIGILVSPEAVTVKAPSWQVEVGALARRAAWRHDNATAAEEFSHELAGVLRHHSGSDSRQQTGGSP